MSIKIREKKLKDGRSSLYLDVYHDGKRSYRFLEMYLINGYKTEDKEADRKTNDLARKALIQLQYNLDIQKHQLEPSKKGKIDLVDFISEIAERKTTKKPYVLAVKTIQKFLDNKRISLTDIDTPWLLKLQDFMQTLDISDTTVRMRMNILGVLLQDAVEAGIINYNPVHQLPKKKRISASPFERVFLTIDELRTLAATETKVAKMIRDCFLFSCYTGLRVSDLHKLRFDQIFKSTDDNWQITFKQKKTGNVEYLPLSGEAVKIYLSRLAEVKAAKIALEEDFSPSELIFRKPGTSDTAHSLGTWINKGLKKWAKEAGITKNLHIHIARHTFATLALNHGAELYTVSKLLGHTSINPTMIYAKVADSLKRQAVTNLPKLSDE